MLLYSKLHSLLTNRETVDSYGMNCVVKELYGINGELRYVYFVTENGTPCLLHISPEHTIDLKSAKKLTNLEPCEDRDPTNFDSILTAETSVVKEIKVYTSPKNLTDFILRLEPAVNHVPYKVGVLTPDHLVVSGTVFSTNGIGSKDLELVIIVELETVLKRNSVSLLDKVYKTLTKLVTDSNESYWNSLLDLLVKCQQMKIVTKGKSLVKQEKDFVRRNIKMASAHKAITLALEAWD
jgi:hypothetical protein